MSTTIRIPTLETGGSTPPDGGGPSTVEQLPADLDLPRRVDSRTFDDNASIVGAMVASLATVWVLYEQIFPTSGKTGFFMLWYVLFLGFYALVTSQKHPRPVVIDKVCSALISGLAFVVAAALLWTILFVVAKGYRPLGHLNFFTQTQQSAGPTTPLTQGGIFNALVGSAVELAIAAAISVPAGIGVAIYMTEVGGRLSRIVRTVIDAMTALPDLVAGLFVYFLVIVLFAHFRWAAQSFANKNGLAVALALSITMLPIIARSSDVVLRVVPGGLREAGLALGSSQWSVVRRVVLPTARSGLATAVILGLARAVGESAPVLIVSAPSTFFQLSPLKNPMNSLSLAAYNSLRFGITKAQIERGYGTALVLLTFVMILFVIIRFLSRPRVSR
jgi:phosphate transport system permease protein